MISHVQNCKLPSFLRIAGMSLAEFDKKNLIIWENINALEYLRKSTAQTTDTMENLVNITSARFLIICILHCFYIGA